MILDPETDCGWDGHSPAQDVQNFRGIEKRTHD
jgi:hypothetical protein